MKSLKIGTIIKLLDFSSSVPETMLFPNDSIFDETVNRYVKGTLCWQCETEKEEGISFLEASRQNILFFKIIKTQGSFVTENSLYRDGIISKEAKRNDTIIEELTTGIKVATNERFLIKKEHKK
ncbi:MAG: hypothetical protein SVO01_00245 [Thermotogota bacterium]|nr:hypothetical protein [Thermotogota bacterium]